MLKLLFAILSLTDILVNQKVAKPIRAWVGIDHRNGYPATDIAPPTTFWGQVLSCFRCTSVWVALFFVLIKPFTWLSNTLETTAAFSWLATLVFDVTQRLIRRI